MTTSFMKVRNGLALTPQSGAPSSPNNGDMYYDSTLGTFAYYDDGSWINLASRSDVASATNLTSATITPAVVQNSFIRVTGTTASALCGLAASTAAKKVIIYNQTNTTLTIKYQSATEPTPQNRIITATSADIVLTSGQTAFLIYDDSQQLWVVVSTAGNDSVSGFGVASGFQYAVGDFFLVPSTNPTSYVDSANTTASYVTATNATAGTYRMMCDKTVSITTSGNSFTLSAAPSFTLTVGCILWSSIYQTWAKIASLTSQTSGTLDAGFAGNLTNSSGMVSQALFTLDLTALGDSAHQQRGIDIFPGTSVNQINLSYEDSVAAGDGEFNPVATAAVVASASNSGLQGASGSPSSVTFSKIFTRPSAPAEILNYVLTTNTNSQRLFIAFFPNPNNSSITTSANVIQYIASMYSTSMLNNGGYLSSAFVMTDGSGTSVDASVALSGGLTQVTLSWDYVPGLNTGMPDGDLEVIIEGNVVPRYYTGVVGQYYTEVNPYLIQLSANYSNQSYSVHIRRRQGSIDTSDNNALLLFSMTGVLFPYAGSSAPSGFLLCDGSAVSRTVYASLFGIIGTTYGSGDGTSTFNLPNTQGLFLRGAGSQTVSSRVYNATLGAYTVDSTAVNGLQDTGHSHQESFGALPGESNGIIGNSAYSEFPANVNTQVAAAALIGDYETKPANLAVNYIIKY